MPDLRKEAARVEPKMISFHGDDDRSRGEGWKLVIKTRRTRGDGGLRRFQRRESSSLKPRRKDGEADVEQEKGSCTNGGC